MPAQMTAGTLACGVPAGGRLLKSPPQAAPESARGRQEEPQMETLGDGLSEGETRVLHGGRGHLLWKRAWKVCQNLAETG